MNRSKIKESPKNKGVMEDHTKKALKAMADPIRSQILTFLKDGPKNVPELVELIGEERNKLHFHLDVLVKAGLVQATMRGKKWKEYSLFMPSRPLAAAIVLSEGQINDRKKRNAFDALLNALEVLEGESIPYRDRITSAELCFNYSWSEK